MVFGETLAGIAEVNFQSTIPLAGRVALLEFAAVTSRGRAWLVLALALYLLTPENYLTIRQALPGAIFFSIGADHSVTKLFQFHVCEIRSLQSDLSWHWPPSSC